VPVRKLDSTDAFLVTDLADAPIGVGIVRCAPKVLVDGAELLARATTYAFATFGVQATGASAGINAKPEDRDAALAAFRDEVLGDPALHLSAGTGIGADELGDGSEPVDESLLARGAVAAAVGFSTGSAAAPGPWAARLAESGWGTSIVEGGPDADAEVVFVAGKSGVIDDAVAATITAKVLVPLTPVAVTAKAYATLSRAGTVFVPDALSCAAPLLAIADPSGGDPVERVAAKAGALAGRGVDAWRGMVEQAEAFLSTWQPKLPYGRPLA
jgi:glutamate dehydrogenase/leucine dehydrogenase